MFRVMFPHVVAHPERQTFAFQPEEKPRREQRLLAERRHQRACLAKGGPRLRPGFPRAQQSRGAHIGDVERVHLVPGIARLRPHRLFAAQACLDVTREPPLPDGDMPGDVARAPAVVAEWRLRAGGSGQRAIEARASLIDLAQQRRLVLRLRSLAAALVVRHDPRPPPERRGRRAGRARRRSRASRCPRWGHRQAPPPAA